MSASPSSRRHPTLALAFGLSSLIVIAACRATPAPSIFQIPRAEFFARTRVVAVLPLQAARRAGLERVARGIEAEIENELEGYGLSVVPASVFQTLWDDRAASSPGIFDPMTGELDQARFNDLMSGCLEALAEQQPFDVVLVPTLVTVRALFRDGYARWDGTTERVIGPDSWDSDIETYEGRLPALSLRIRIRDRAGIALYQHQAGLQLWTQMGASTQTTRDLEDLLADPGRNRAAARQALAPLHDDG